MTAVFLRTTSIYYDSRAIKEIKALLQCAEKVIVLGWDREGEASEKCRKLFAQSDQITFCFYQAKLQDGIGIRHIDKLMGWMHWAYKQLKGINGISLVHACDLDAGIPAIWFCKRKSIPLVYDIYDYYIDSHFIPRVLETIVEKWEIKIINYAAVTIICTEERMKQIDKSKPKKVIVIHNSPEIGFGLETNIEYDYAYFGGLNDERMIGEILQEYPNNTDLRFCLGGYGKYSEMAKELSMKYDNFTFTGPLPYQEVLEIENKTKCLSAIYDPSWRNHQLCAPNKFYEALALGKPIIACKGTGIDEIIEQKQIGKVIEFNAKSFYASLRELLQNSPMCTEIGERGRVLFQKKYHWDIMRKRLIAAYKSIMK